MTADPPSALSWSGGYYGDEAGYAHNARNKALFGKWVLDEFNPYLFNPILTLSDFISFKIFHPSIFSLRVVAFFWGVLGIFFVSGTLKEVTESFWMVFLGVILLETNYFFLMFTRMSLSDTMLTNWMLMTLFFWAIGLKKPVFRFLAGLSAVGVLSCKPTAAYFAIIVFIATLFHFLQEGCKGRKNWREFIRHIASLAAGFLSGFSLWLCFFYIPHYSEITRISTLWSKLSLPKNLGDFATYTVGTYAPIVFKYFSWFPFIFLMGWIYLPVSLYRLLKNRKEYNVLELFSLLWFVVGYFAISGFHYRPPRYYISLVPPIVFLALFGLRQVAAFKMEFLKKNILFVSVYSGWIVLTLFLIKAYIHFNLPRLWVVGVLFLISAGLAYLSKKIFFQHRTHMGIGFYIVLLIVTLALSQNLSLYGKWWSNASYQVVNTSKKIGNFVNNGMVAGLWAPMLCMENKNRTLYIASHWFNYDKPYERYHFTHLVLWRGNFDAELTLIKKPLGKEFIKKRLKLIDEFAIKGARTMFFKVTPK